MKFNQTDRTFLLILLLLVVCLLAIWFRQGNLFIGAEEGIIFQRIDLVYQKMVSSVWLDLYLGVPYFSDLSKRPLYGFLTLLFRGGVHPFFLQIGTFGLILAGAVISSYLLFRKTFAWILSPRLAAFFGALFYLSNPYVISQVWARGLYPQFFAYLYYPVFLLLIAYYFDSKQRLYLIINLIISFLFSAAMGNPSYAISLWILASGFWLYKTFETRGSFLNICRQLIVFGLFLISWVIINSWWLLVTVWYAPAAFLGTGNVFENALSSLRAVSSQYSFDSVIRLYHPLHFESSLYFGIYKTGVFQVLSWLGVVVVIFSLRYFRQKSVQFYWGMFFVGLIVCLGSNPPLGFLFESIFTHFTPLQVFRNPYEKFGLVYLLAYSGLFGVGLTGLFVFIRNISNRWAFSSITVLLVMIIGLFNWPLWSGEVIGWGTSTNIPERYQILDNWQETDNSTGGRLFFTPYLSSFGASYKWQGADYHGNDPLYQLVDASVITQTGTNPYLMALKEYIGSKELTPALRRIDVRYIIDRSDVKSTRQDKKSLDLLTKNFFIPTQKVDFLCQPMKFDELHFSCFISSDLQSLSEVQKLRVIFRSDSAGFIDVSLVDQNSSQPRWSGEKESQLNYSAQESGRTKTIDLSLFNPTENPDTDFTQIKQIEIYFRPQSISKPVNFEVDSISTIRGEKRYITGVNQLGSIDGLKIFQMDQSDLTHPIKAFSHIEFVESYDQLFDSFKQSKETAYLFKPISTDYSLTEIPLQTKIQTIALSPTTYLVTLSEAGTYFLRLNQNFNSEWKLIYINSSDKTNLNFFDQLSLFFSKELDSSSHFLTDGYANGWLVKADSSTQVVIVYMPQIMMEILWPISVSFLGLLICFVTGFYILKK